jgi:hypothetical protein
VQRHRDKKFYLIEKTAVLKRRIRQKSKHRIQLRPAFLERKYHFTQSIVINTASCYFVEIKLLAPAIPARPANQPIHAYIPPTPPAVITADTAGKLTPAILAQGLVGLRNALAAVDTHRRPQKLVQTL